MASRIPPDLSYLLTLKESGVSSALNLTEMDWPGEWKGSWGGDYMHIPVYDLGIPTEEQAVNALRFIEEGLLTGAVMVHCFAGLGRTGTIIALYLVESGIEPRDAVELVRSRRPGSLEVLEQEEFVLSWRRGGGS
ncbi:MAG: dual specificity protein phosphatase family protein [Candidatus Thermoplasmatota archaeon]|nr:dual specificity protein phosphatase family protein [Candidatus Thermoplasmatota archaeon]